ncbi:uncharacterized protein B0I36DRAFT_426554 [Microdochium trichocladiopsis]|uniref:Enoyl reductase (ER) domain-containing protein n=1 Tax=Microdochium trichocladiopsis TaxID=1682393 RepID=A0A9P8YJ59_9PEZI|nr:uncharacterized protein B0I36DRAFT_426554 [Microdochium trichocladiopsis]KAH7040000.1 hypothetical protein B0I36DRAFT_426554 [Microdochium trichocladiopsis]
MSSSSSSSSLPPPPREIPKTMKAVQVTAFHEPYRLNPSAPAPDPDALGPDDLIVKIAAASHCHTDEMVREGVFGTRLPCTGSHEGAGTVVAVGKSSRSRRGGGGGGGAVAGGGSSGAGTGAGAETTAAGGLSYSAGGVGTLNISDSVNNIAAIDPNAPGGSSFGCNKTLDSGSNTACTNISHSLGGGGGGGAAHSAPAQHHHHSYTDDTWQQQGPSFRVGDRVMCGLPYQPCSACPDCTGPGSGRRDQYCPNIRGHVGVHLPGNFAEYVVVDRRSTTHLPDAIRFQTAAPLACAGRTVWRGVNGCGLTPGSGEWLAIVGSGGGLGHLAVQFARKLGYNVIGVDARDEGLAMTRRFREDHRPQGGGHATKLVVLDAREGKEEVVKQVQTVTGGRRGSSGGGGGSGAGGADATLVLSDSPGAAALGAAMTRMHGTMVQIAQPEQVCVPFQELVFRDVRIRGSLLCSAEESREMLEFVAEHGIDVRVNLFEGGLGEYEKVMELVKGGNMQGKAVIIVDPQQVKDEEKLGAKY